MIEKKPDDEDVRKKIFKDILGLKEYEERMTIEKFKDLLFEKDLIGSKGEGWNYF